MNTETSHDDLLILALARGCSRRAAAKESGLSVSTITRRMRDPQFVKEVNQCRAEILDRSIGMLVASSATAAKTLRKLCSDKNSMVALAAAKAVIELAGVNAKLIKQTELEQQIKTIEAALQARKRKP